MLDSFDAVAFRQELAGLCDVTEGAEDFGDAREHAVDLVVLMAIGFDRDKLDAKTLWDRIESGLREAIATCPHEDMPAFATSCLEHVLCPINRVIGQGDAEAIQQRLYALQGDESTAVVRYLKEHLYPVMVFGRQRFNELKGAK
ncbi:hypothetical protein [Rubinisphaera brasiliensis]|uniref:Uncharacterized protein n=1 Tax=Rubinisphaera brasiliensis (strain ATCC 49424 / DSM 5305 / JCM 21570 / IAM 15109 / NBRC 103401 / IFAM 1448) TaxID=756272 RepID=F0SPH5_RUBBR|nr:hypothetical protein [Rubinisphaera brasiliensis]ADY57879.1 hypothetical protein Plabr_0250 [Rubinisphaera brasiliensis DSM 5305]